jgi:hypothetical protein
MRRGLTALEVEILSPGGRVICLDCGGPADVLVHMTVKCLTPACEAAAPPPPQTIAYCMGCAERIALVFQALNRRPPPS